MEIDLETKISRQSLSAQVAERLVEEISMGRYAPGDMLPSEQALSLKFGVSRPVVREALTQLSAQGFVEVKNGLGAAVREVNGESLRIFFRRLLLAGDRKDITDIFEIRESLEHLSSIKAAENRTDEDIEQLRETLASMTEHIDTPLTYVQLDAQFHTQIAQFSRNTPLFHLIASIRQTMVSVNNSLRLELGKEEIQDIQENHKEIFQAIADRDREMAQRAMDAHFENLMGRLRRILAADTSG
jgi:DNA-binding FadR family transcriptional regulator